MMKRLRQWAQDIQWWMYERGSAKLVVREGCAYLERFYLLNLPGFKLFLHRFWMNDPDPLHDHPWDWGRLILSGQYREHRISEDLDADCGPGHVVWRRCAGDFHRVELIQGPVVTLFWHWKRQRTWGFLYDEGWRPAPDDGQDGRPMKGWFLPRKVGEVPKEVIHE